MYARKLRNRSGSISVQVIRKENGRYRVVKTFGTSRDPDEIARFWLAAERYARDPDPAQSHLFPLYSGHDHVVQNLVSTFTNANVRTIGPELIFGTIFDRIGFGAIPDALFRHMVLSRLAFPSSKLKTAEYLWRYQGFSVSVDSLYRSLDRLQHRYKAMAEAIVHEHTRSRVGTITAVFYDMTTLHFEAEDEDDLRKIGFSKAGKFECPQIMLGLLVAEAGQPLGYDVFEGNTFEGHTLVPFLEQYVKRYGCARPVVVADAAMLSRRNLAALSSASYEFIVGARIKNESEAIKREILARAEGMTHGDSFVLRRPDGLVLVVTYSQRRARKDAFNRDKGLRRLQSRIKSGRLTKQNLNRRGYNKFLALEGEIHVHVDEQKIEEDQQWDGLKGYVTNTSLAPERIVDLYGQLWEVERAFRISKTDLRIRPIHHFVRRRIEGHLCLSFVAYAIYKELEWLMKQKGLTLSGARAGELCQTMYELEYVLPDSKHTVRQILRMDPDQQAIYDAVHA
jgi:hypothetical protein